MKPTAAVAAIPLALMIPWLRKPATLQGWKRRVVVAGGALCTLPIAIGTGSCVLGGLVQGSGFCSIRRRGVAWDPVADFSAIQAAWSLMFLLAAFFAALSLLSLLPGRVTGWERFLFLVSAGRRGAWKEAPLVIPANPAAEKLLAALQTRIAGETDPARKAKLLAEVATVRATQEKHAHLACEMDAWRKRIDRLDRGARVLPWLVLVFSAPLSLAFLVPFVLGAVTHETVTLGHRLPTRMVSLDAEPLLFWFTMAASPVFSLLMARLALVSLRALRGGRTAEGAPTTRPGR